MNCLNAALQIRTDQRSSAVNLWPLTVHIYQVMIIDRWFFKEVFFYHFQKQRYADVPQNSCYQEICNIHRKTSLLQSLFSKVAFLTAFNLISTLSQKRLQHRCFPVNIAKFYEQLFLQNTSGDCFCQFDEVASSTGLLFLIKSRKCGIVSTKNDCKSVQSMLFAHYQQKPFQHAFID